MVPIDAFNFLRSPVFLLDMLQIKFVASQPFSKVSSRDVARSNLFSSFIWPKSFSKKCLGSFRSLKSFLQFHLLKVFLQEMPGARFTRSNPFSNFTCSKSFSKIYLEFASLAQIFSPTSLAQSLSPRYSW